MNQFFLGIKLFLKSVLFTLKNPSTLIYLIGYFVISFFLLAPFALYLQQTPNVFFGIIVFILNVLFLFLMFILMVSTINRIHKIIMGETTDFSHDISKGFSKIVTLIAYLIVSGIYYILFGGLIFYILYKATIPATISLKELSNYINILSVASAENIAASADMQSVASFIFLLTIAMTAVWLIGQLLVFFFLPAITVGNQSFVDGFKNALRSLPHHIITIIIGSLLFLGLAYLNTKIALFVPVQFANFITGFINWFLITAFLVFKTLLYLKVKHRLPAGHDPEHNG